MTTILLSSVFVLGYLAIALEHPLKVNKAATALFIAVICWVIYTFGSHGHNEEVLAHLGEHLSDVAQILFFLIGAMTIVEIVDSHKGFNAIAGMISTSKKRHLLWLSSLITFFLSAILDNLTTSIVMVSLLRKLIKDKNDRMIFASLTIIAANAGGAWTPIGDVTTTMLWIGGQVSSLGIMKALFVPSIICLIVPLIYQSMFIKGEIEEKFDVTQQTKEPHSNLILAVGVGGLIFVPIFKTVTHLPPYLGMLLSLSVLWFLTDLLHHKYDDRSHLKLGHALSRIDVSSVLFFLGILLAVAALQTAGILASFAGMLDSGIGNKDVIVTILGLLSSIIDNVPLVAASMGMYDLAQFPMDSRLWELMAYCAGTGGSILIIGSAAGVVVMGMEKIDFMWYMKKISFTAMLGYFAGLFAFILLNL